MTHRKFISLAYALILITGSSMIHAAELIQSVEDADYRITDTNPPQLHVTATGTVTTGGWGFPQLKVYAQQKPPVQGVLEYDFMAEAPEDYQVVIQQEMPIHANNLYHDYYPGITAIKINTKTNSKLIEIEAPEQVAE